jgi:hypothetical protein
LEPRRGCNNTTKIETFLEIMSLHNLVVGKATLAQNHPSVLVLVY